MVSLDDPLLLQAPGTGSMLQAVMMVPHDARRALENAEKLDLSGLENRWYKGLLIAGMGGSAVGGLLLRDWLMDNSPIPIHVSRGYRLPAWVDEDTLVYAVSYSGDTEETLSQFREALTRGCPTVCFASGGELTRSAGLHGLPCLGYPKGYQPRAAIAHQFFGLAATTRRLGLIDDETWGQVDEALVILEELRGRMSPDTPTSTNPAKRLAMSLKGYIPFVYGGEAYETVVYRYTTQLNENSKSPAAYNFIPEAFHNSVMAREAGPDLLERCCAVVINDPGETSLKPKVKRFKDLLSESFGKLVEVDAGGEGKLARMLSALYTGDFTSVYLSVLYGKDPSSTDSIISLKNPGPGKAQHE